MIIEKAKRMTWRVLVAIAALCVFAACAAQPTVVPHAFSFDTSQDGQDGEVLDYRYGDSKLPVRAPESYVKKGQVFRQNSVNGPMLRGDSLYVKWRTRDSGKIYEDTVDLRKRLPADIREHRIHFQVKGGQLYVYLISPETMPSGQFSTGPSMFKREVVKTIYPD